ncbi:MAG: tRNA (guanosine(46)-N7)-methyltransferase TrmB [Rhodospirillaceae bacterium]
MRDLLPRIAVPDDGPVDAGSLFINDGRHLWVEIGFGAGEHLAAQAAAHPDIGFIGAEPFVNGVASLLAQIDAAHLDNIRVFAEDARLLLPRLPDGSVDRVYLLYSDPWPKKRHWDRRFVQTETLGQLARVIRPGGEFRFATDHMDHARWALWRLIRHPAFEWTARGPADWRDRPKDGFPTRYEEKQLAGSKPVYLTFRRRAD